MFLQLTQTIFTLVQNIIGTNLLTKFHDDWTINLASRVLTSHVFQLAGTIFKIIQDIIEKNLMTKKNAPPPGGHPFLNLSKISLGQTVQTKFHDDRKINVASRMLTRKNAPPPGGHVFQPTGIIFKLVQDINGINLLTKFHEDLTINVTIYSHIRKNAPPLGSHVFQANKFHKDWTINVAS
ncbi:hypothetical protein DPMN_118057 [Dreissena polymorpha]|uniref:Uncharacterized protein n=1 Tax=Dreissena polymorpha TaxID=45954 RepID=A0A9D4GK37_DREPO|nr:hypothetical protein DPMN_118057 [Dreissena polymorpha]